MCNGKANKLSEKKGLNMTAWLLLMLNLNADPMCFSSDVKSICCPSACAAKKSSKWPQADEILQGCMHVLGCSVGKSDTVSMHCDC